MKRRFIRKYARYAPGAAYGIYQGAKQMFRKSRSYTKTRTRSRRSSGPLTGQFDYKVDYVKRRLGRRGRRRAKRTRKWRRKVVRTVQNQMIGTTHIVRQHLDTLTTARGQSDSCHFVLNGLNGQPGNGRVACNDIGEMIREMAPSSWVDMENFAVNAVNSRLAVLQATMEITVRNNSNEDILLEAYHIRGKKKFTNNVMPSPSQMYWEGFNRQQRAINPENEAPMGENRLNHTIIGVTPFQNQLFTQHWTIYKRTKFRINPGQEVSFIVKGRPSTYRAQDTYSNSFDSRTTGILFQQQGPPAPASTEPPLPATPALPSTAEYLAIKRYRIKMLYNNLARDAQDQQGD